MFESIPVLSLTILLPLIGAILCFSLGKRADLVIFDRGELPWPPEGSGGHSLVFGAATRPREVVVGGRWLVREGQLVTDDWAEIRAAATTARTHLLARTP